MSANHWKTLLIVDDEPEIREILADDLDPYEVRVLRASDGLEALEILGREAVDAVLTDIRMPRLDGIGLTERIRQGGSMVPVIFLTAFSEKDYLLAALRLGATDFLIKPYKIDELLRQVGYALELGARLRQAPVDPGPGVPELILHALKQLQVIHEMNAINKRSTDLPLKRKNAA